MESHAVSAFTIEKSSGSWDDDAIELIADRIGFSLILRPETYRAIKQPFKDDLGPLRLVKKLRNSLAHGSISFAECGQNLTVSELRDLTEHIAVYLREVVRSFSNFIEGHEFLIAAKRPAQNAVQ